MTKLIKKIRNLYENKHFQTIFGCISVIAGLGLVLDPQGTSIYIIQGIGVLWILDGVRKLF